MKLFNLILLCLFTISAHSQNNQTPDENSISNGNYSFTKAILTVYNSDTKKEVLTQTFNDTTSLKEIIKLPFPIHPIFLSAVIDSGILRGCKLWNNDKDYIVKSNGTLLEAINETNDSSDDIHRENDKNLDIFFDHYQLSPLYSLKLKGRTATFNFRENFGNSLYDFPLEGKLTIILDKD